MQEEQLFINNELTLAELVKAIEQSSNRLSGLLNGSIKQGFYGYVNGFRINYAQQLFADQQCKLSILEIAYALGFSSKNTFYKCFKQTLDTTPSIYRKRIQNLASKEIPEDISPSV